MNNDHADKHRYVFVCGMPRSGTSVLGRNIGRLEDCTDFRNTGVLEDEGQYLQEVYPIASKLGGAGDFGFDPRAHRTESSSLLTPENISRLRACWHAHWDCSKTICVEKTPGNLLMTRFLQAAFPNSYFIIIKRHPVPVAMAAQKWKVDVTSLDTALKHWLHCHEIYEADKKHLRNVYELRYEDYVEDSAKYHQEIAAFIGTRVTDQRSDERLRRVTQWQNPSGLLVSESEMEPTTGAHNRRYFERWTVLLTNSFFKVYYRYMAQKYEAQFTMHGYSLIKGLRTNQELLHLGGFSRTFGAFCCQGANACALYWRFVTQTRFHAKRLGKHVFRRKRAWNSLNTSPVAGEADSLDRVRQMGPYSY